MLHGSKTYLAASSLIGAVALAVGIIAVFPQTEAMLHLLIGVTVALWIIATVRHTMAANAADRSPLVS